MEEAAYVYWLKSLQGLGNQALKVLLGVPGGARAVYELDEKQLRAMRLGLKEEKMEMLLSHRKAGCLGRMYEELQKKEIKITWLGDQNYPPRLQQIPDPPTVLFYKGKIPDAEKKHVAVVGARDCTEYGAYAARTIGEALAKSEIVLVSGMARGIDGLSQRAAISMHGMSVAVLGCGVDVCYPAQNRELYETLVQEGCVLSEYLPGTQPAARLFPARNRIISGLADTLVVVEAREKSGTFITVDMALEQGKDVYAVPGRLTDPLSVGCNKLIHQGAYMFQGIDDFLKQMGERSVTCMSLEASAPQSAFLTEREKQLYEMLDFQPMNLEELYARMESKEEWNLQELMWELLQLCIKGVARQVGANSYVRTM